MLKGTGLCRRLDLSTAIRPSSLSMVHPPHSVYGVNTPYQKGIDGDVFVESNQGRLGGWGNSFGLLSHIKNPWVALNNFVLLFGPLRLWFLHLGGFGLFCGAFQIQPQQPLQNLFITQTGRPAVGGGNGSVKFLVAKSSQSGRLL
jgi:hypothetical protein